MEGIDAWIDGWLTYVYASISGLITCIGDYMWRTGFRSGGLMQRKSTDGHMNEHIDGCMCDEWMAA